MRYLSLVITLLIACSAWAQQAKRTVLSGSVKHSIPGGVISVYYYPTASGEIEGHKVYQSVRPDSNGNYHFVFDLVRPVNFYLRDSAAWLSHNNYLAPGDSLVMHFTDEGINVDGDCNYCIAFLEDYAATYLLNDSLQHLKQQMRMQPPKEFTAFADNQRLEALQFLEGHPFASQMPEAFKKYFIASVNYRYAGDLLRYSWAHPKVWSDEIYLSFLGKVPAMDKEVLDNPAYIGYLRELPYATWRAMAYSRDSAARSYYFDHQYRLRDSIARIYFSGPVYDLALYTILNDQLKALSMERGTAAFERSYHQCDSVFQHYATAFGDARLSQQLRMRLQELKQPQPAPNFQLMDLAGNRVQLSDFKGKVVYLDFWATTCIPCLKEFPHAKALTETFANEENFVFLTISIGDRPDVWRSFLNKQQAPGVHLIEPGGLVSEVATAYGVSGLPRYFLIDRDGYIITNNALRPSQHPEDAIFRALSH